MNKDYAYPTAVGSILFYGIPTLYALGWLSTVLFPEQIEALIFESSADFNFRYSISVLLTTLLFWMLGFSAYLLLLGRRCIKFQQFPPENFYIWFKTKYTYGRKAIITGIVLLISGLLVMGATGVIGYATYIL